MISVVITAYKIPDQRRHDFFRWNDRIFRKNEISVVLVSDRSVDVPDYAACLVYPHEMERFNLAKTSNYGIRHVGQGTIVKSDIDCVFTNEALYWFKQVREGYGVCLKYCMIKDVKQIPVENWIRTRWSSSRGTFALDWADWEKLCGYNEKMSGYGIEDGDATGRAKKYAEIYFPQVPFYHIAHKGGEQMDQLRRADQWNRDDGFNPHNRKENQMLVGKWGDDYKDIWGRADVNI